MMYKPNYDDPRTHAKILHIITWIETYVGAHPNKHLQSTILRSPEAFGDSQLSRYLRNCLLVKVNHGYQPGKFSQSYRVNIDYLDKLRSRIGLEPSKLRRIDIEERFNLQNVNLETGEFEYNSSGGRWYNGLQYISKDIKKQLFAERGYSYDYDIECCAPTLFLQRARQIKPRMKSLEYIEFYLTHKTQVRDELSIKYNLSSKQIKQVLNSLFQGGVLNTYYDNNTFRYLNRNVTQMNLLKQDEFIKALQKDIKYMWKILRSDVSSTLNINFKRLNGRYKSNYYKILEGSIMTHVWSYLKKIKVKCFKEHDGFRSDVFVVPSELEQIVKTNTGYQVKFVWDKVGVIDTNV